MSPRRSTLSRRLSSAVALAVCSCLVSLTVGAWSVNHAVSVVPTVSRSGSLSGLVGKCADNRNVTASGGTLRLYMCNGTTAQEWLFYSDGTIRNLSLCLDGGNGAVGATANVAICTGDARQRWVVSTPGPLVNAATKLCLGVNGSNAESGTVLDHEICAGTAAQRWIPPSYARSLYKPPSGRAYLGVAATLTALPAFDQATGMPGGPAIFNSFTKRDGDFGAELARVATRPDLTPMVTWSVTFTNNRITNGSQDDYIKAAAKAAAAFNRPLFVRLDWEMNGLWSPFFDRTGGVTPAQFIASWRYIYNYFRTIAPKAAFVWAPNIGLPADTPNGYPKLSSSAWYPGDSYCEWIGVSAYPEYSDPPAIVRTKPEGLDYYARYAAGKDKPLMLAEWARGTLTQPYSADTSLPFDIVFGWEADFPDTVKALVYFDMVDDRDHVLETHPVGAAAFRSYTVGKARYLYSVVTP